LAPAVINEKTVYNSTCPVLVGGRVIRRHANSAPAGSTKSRTRRINDQSQSSYEQFSKKLGGKLLEVHDSLDIRLP
jgi:hypothetical protein